MPTFDYAKVGSSEVSDDDTREDQTVQQGFNRLPRRLKSLETFSFLKWPIAIFLLSAILICELAILHKTAPGPIKAGQDLNRVVPDFPVTPVIFRNSDHYHSDHKTEGSYNASVQAWQDLVPRGRGFIHVENYDKYTLPPPMHFKVAPGKDVYEPAIFHQIHCLMRLSVFMDKLIFKISENDMRPLETGEVDHSDHCFNYIRNTILCCGDTTLEGQSQTPMFRNISTTDGTGAVHMCRNYDEIVAWAESNRLSDAGEVLG